MEYNLFIGILLLFSILDVFVLKSKKVVLIIFVIILYQLFFGLRGFIAWDWFHYYPRFLTSIGIFEAIKNWNFIFNTGPSVSYEIGYQVWMSLFKSLTNSYHIYLFLTTLIDIFVISYVFFKYSPYPVFSILLFLGFGGLQIQLDLMRNIKAIFLFLISLDYLSKNKKIKYLLINILALSFHRTSLLYLPLIFFLRKKIYKYRKTILFLFGIGIIILIFSNDLLFIVLKKIKEILEYANLNILNGIKKKLSSYLLNSYANSRELGIGFIERVGTFILFYTYRKKINNYKYGTIFFNLYLLYVFTYLYGSGVRIIFERCGLLFIPAYWILYPILLKNMNKNKKIGLFILLSLYIILKINKETNFSIKAKELYEYKNIIFTQESYKEKKLIFDKVLKRYERNLNREN